MNSMYTIIVLIEKFLRKILPDEKSKLWYVHLFDSKTGEVKFEELNEPLEGRE